MNKIQDIPPELEKMLFDYYIKHGESRYTTDYWIDMTNSRIKKLMVHGYDKFRHTVASDFSMFLVEPNSPEAIKLLKAQLVFLIKNLSRKEVSYAKKLAQKFPIFPYTIKEFNWITLLLWQYAKNQGLKKELAQLSEPPEGSPPAIYFEGRLISQGIAYSLLEFDFMRKNIEPDPVKTIMSIGPGYGRTAYVWLRLRKVQKFFFVDIPPALYITQRYLGTLFPRKRVFKYRDFKSFDEISDEYEHVDLVFLMPWQIELLPGKSVDLIYAVDSFDEMNIDIIKLYLKNVNRLGKGYFYMKNWKEWMSEHGAIKQKDYPIPASWECIATRECKVQTNHFESLYELPSDVKPIL